MNKRPYPLERVAPIRILSNEYDPVDARQFAESVKNQLEWITSLQKLLDTDVLECNNQPRCVRGRVNKDHDPHVDLRSAGA